MTEEYKQKSESILYTYMFILSIIGVYIYCQTGKTQCDFFHIILNFIKSVASFYIIWYLFLYTPIRWILKFLFMAKFINLFYYPYIIANIYLLYYLNTKGRLSHIDDIVAFITLNLLIYPMFHLAKLRISYEKSETSDMDSYVYTSSIPTSTKTFDNDEDEWDKEYENVSKSSNNDTNITQSNKKDVSKNRKSNKLNESTIQSLNNVDDSNKTYFELSTIDNETDFISNVIDNKQTNMIKCQICEKEYNIKQIFCPFCGEKNPTIK